MRIWSLHISELTSRNLFSLFIPWACKREKKLTFDAFLLFRLLLWWAEVWKKSLKFEGKVYRLFSGKQMFLKWWQHKHSTRKLPPLLPVRLSVAHCLSPGALSSTELQGLPLGKKARNGEFSNTAFCTAHNNIYINTYGLSELMKPSWFWKAFLFYYSDNFTRRLLC